MGRYMFLSYWWVQDSPGMQVKDYNEELGLSRHIPGDYRWRSGEEIVLTF